MLTWPPPGLSPRLKAFPPLEDVDMLGRHADKARYPIEEDEAEWPAPMVADAVAPELTADMQPGWLGAYVGALASQRKNAGNHVCAVRAVWYYVCVQRRYVVRVHEGYTESVGFLESERSAGGSSINRRIGAAGGYQAWEERAR